MDRVTAAPPRLSRDEILAKLKTIVAESLAVDEADVKLESRLVSELGADSLDFIDMVFLVEKRFGVKVREGEFDFFSRLDFSSPTVMKDGFLTRETVDHLVDWLPPLRTAPDLGKITPRELFGMITVETLCLMVERRV